MKVDERDDVSLEKPLAEVWQQALDVISEHKLLALPTILSWVKPLQLVELGDSEAVVAAANEFNTSMIGNNVRHQIEVALSEVVARPIIVRLIIDPTIEVPYTPSIAAISVTPARENVLDDPRLATIDATQGLQAANLNPKYTMDAFVVGSHNSFCHSAAMAVAERPAQSYNPLFIYGGVGLGKTHLMHAIGNCIVRNFPTKKVRYITCERFTNDLINAIRDDRTLDFRKRYRQVDVLLMDDIQFIAGKERTQEEFFHTFNTLREEQKQIILSSDRPPKEIATLEERLRSRFEWGLLADIQAPDLETRVAILRKKIASEHMHVSDEVLEYIASVFTGNIRELEGALLRAHAYANLTGSNLNLLTAMNVLQSGGPKKQKPTITVEKIIDTVAAHYHLEPSDLRSAKRSQDLALPRHIAMYLVQDLLSMSTPRIGECFGNRKHTSVLHAIKKVKESIVENPSLSVSIKEIARQLSN